MNEIKEKTISSLFWKILERGGSAFVQVVVQIVLARLLMPEDFGLLAILLVFVNLGNVVVQSGLNTSLVQAAQTEDDDFSTVFWMSFGISLALYAIVFFAAPTLATFYESPHLVWPLRIIALVLVINAYNAVQIAKVSRELDFKKVFFATFLSVIASGILGVIAAITGAGLWSLVIQQIVCQLTICVVLSVQVSWHPKLVFLPKRAQLHFSFGWKLLVSGLLETGYQSLSDLIIGKQFSVTDLGIVSQGKKYPQAIGNMLDGAIQPVMLSAVARCQDDTASVKRLVRRALKTSTFFIIPAMGMIALVAKPLVCIVLGEQWLPAVPFLQAYCFVFALLPIHTSNLQALNGVGRTDIFLKLEIIKKAIGFTVLLYSAFVLQSVWAVVLGYLVSGLLCTFVNAYPTKQIIAYSYFEQLRDIMPALFLTAASAFLAWSVGLFDLQEPVLLVLQCAVMAASYLLLAKTFHVEELQYLSKVSHEFFASKKA